MASRYKHPIVSPLNALLRKSERWGPFLLHRPGSGPAESEEVADLGLGGLAGNHGRPCGSAWLSGPRHPPQRRDSWEGHSRGALCQQRAEGRAKWWSWAPPAGCEADWSPVPTCMALFLQTALTPAPQTLSSRWGAPTGQGSFISGNAIPSLACEYFISRLKIEAEPSLLLQEGGGGGAGSVSGWFGYFS